MSMAGWCPIRREHAVAECPDPKWCRCCKALCNHKRTRGERLSESEIVAAAQRGEPIIKKLHEPLDPYAP